MTGGSVVRDGDLWCPPRVVGPAELARLSRRRLEVVKLAAEGLSNEEIAERLYITEDTVKLHMQKAFRVLRVGGANARVQMATRLHRREVVIELDTHTGRIPRL